MSGQAVTSAREILAGYDRGNWTAEINLIGHLAGAVRMLLGVIDGQAAALGAAQLATVLDALDVAGEHRRHRASLSCGDCAQEPGGLCSDHAADLIRAGEYDDLAAQLAGPHAIGGGDPQ